MQELELLKKLMPPPDLEEQVKKAIRIIPDFPKPGISFKDITPVLLDPFLVRSAVKAMAAPFRDMNITRVVGIESRGFLLGPMIAQELNAGFVIVRKEGKLPHKTIGVSYDLEYGNATIEVHKDAITEKDNIIVHDDLLATGGTASAAAELAEKLGAKTKGFTFLVELTKLGGRKKLEKFSPVIFSLVKYEY